MLQNAPVIASLVIKHDGTGYVSKSACVQVVLITHVGFLLQPIAGCMHMSLAIAAA